MADIRTLHEALVAAGPGHKITIEGVDNVNEFHTIRTALVKKWSDHKNMLLIIGMDETSVEFGYSMCGDWNSTDRTATFFLGKNRRKTAKQYTFAIVPSQDSTVAGTTATELAVTEAISDDNNTAASHHAADIERAVNLLIGNS